MNAKVVRGVIKWMSCAAVISSVAYSTLVLAAKPALAASNCTAEECTLAEELAKDYCTNFGGVLEFSCSTNSTGWDFVCVDGESRSGPCDAL